MNATVSEGSLAPIAVGRYIKADGGRETLPYSLHEIERSQAAMLRVLQTFHFRTGSNVLLTALLDEGAQAIGMERAVKSYGMVVVSADSSLFDARRVESIIRRFKPVAAVGVTAATLDGLQGLGFDLAQLFAGIVVWARPGAYERLSTLPGLSVRRWVELGPAVGLECHAGCGPHLDHAEWHVDTDAGEIVLTSRLERAQRFTHYRTGLRGRIVRGFCACGNADPRLMLE
jgi:phenylacetate-coenzyme A ligase PaaK-like adenylate-forming protein